MANSQDYLNALGQQHPGVDLSSSPDLLNAANRAQNSGQSVNDFVTNNLNHPAIGQAYTDYYTKQAQPSIDSVNTQIGTLNSAKSLSDQSALSSINTENNTADNAVRNQQVAGYAQQDNLANQADAAGLGRSGGLVTASNNVNQDVSRNVSYTQAQQANAIAQLGISNSQNKNQIQGTIDQLNGVNAATTSSAVLAARQANLQDNNEVYQRNLQMFNAGQGLAQGRSVQIAPGYTINGTNNDTNGFISALTSLMPLASASSDPGSVLRSYIPALQNQYGVNSGGDVNAAINNLVSASKTARATTQASPNSYSGSQPTQQSSAQQPASQQPAAQAAAPTIPDLFSFLNNSAFAKDSPNRGTPWWTENTLLPQLENKYPQFDWSPNGQAFHALFLARKLSWNQ